MNIFRNLLIFLILIDVLSSSGQLSSKSPFVALVADNVYKNGHLPVTNLEHFKGNEILYVRGFLSLVHRSGLSWEFRDTVVHLAGVELPKRYNALLDKRTNWLKSRTQENERFVTAGCTIHTLDIVYPFCEMCLVDDRSGLLIAWEESSYKKMIVEVRNIFDEIILTDTTSNSSYCYRPTRLTELEIIKLTAADMPDEYMYFAVKYGKLPDPSVRPCNFNNVTHAVVYALIHEDPYFYPSLYGWQEAMKFDGFHYFRQYYEAFVSRNDWRR
jgi:hypothetical protein